MIGRPVDKRQSCHLLLKDERLLLYTMQDFDSFAEWIRNWQSYDGISARANVRNTIRYHLIKEGSGRLAFQNIQQINSLLYNGLAELSGAAGFSADGDRWSSSVGISLGGSKDSKLFL